MAGGHHGGAWKVAYADFVTAMMAFFLLLWLLSVTTREQKVKIASYFSPTDSRIAQYMSGSGGVLGGTTLSDEGSMTGNGGQPSDSVPMAEGGQDDLEKQKRYEAMDQQDEKSFQSVEENIRQAVEATPDLKGLSKNLMMDMTPEGLRIQIVDQEGQPMFPLGSPAPLPQTVKLLTVVAGAVKELPNKISIRGHTDSKSYGKDTSYTNWELSADRSNASRRVMQEAGFDSVRVENVQGKADREPLDIAVPDSARNRRISIILLKQSLVAVAKKADENFKHRKPDDEKPAPKAREKGVLYFP
ncbi:MAG: OmpA family protein [Alphaproteobacteria bacterium]|nr:OmpA family protein [Alphaproteobacteria bacterium]